MAVTMPSVRRRWRRISRSQSGSSESLSLAADASIEEVFASSRCVVLLGPPGSGKSTDLALCKSVLRGSVTEIHLGGFASQDRLVRLLQQELSEVEPAGPDVEPVTLALDSLDELPTGMASFASIVEHELRSAIDCGLRLIIACRTAAWHSVVESALKRAFGETEVYELEPFGEGEARQIAELRGADPDKFVMAVEGARAQALLGLPITLQLLIEEFLADPHEGLPPTQESLYRRGSCRLLREPNRERISPDRINQAVGSLDVAGHLAVVTLFSSMQAVTLLQATGSADEDASSLSVADLLPGEIATLVGEGRLTSRSLSAQDVSDVLGSALFRGTGDGSVRWYHQTVQEYLAARYLCDIGAARKFINELFRLDDSRLPAQLQAVGAWLVVLDEEGYGALLKNDPEAFVQTGKELKDHSYRELLVRNLLALAESSELEYDFSRFETDLSFPGLSSLLGEAMSSPGNSLEQRHLAIRIARGNEVIDTLPALMSIAFDHSLPVHLRTSAGHAVAGFGGLEDRRQLLSLLDTGAETDPDDELYGLALSVKLELSGSPSEVLSLVRRPRNSDLFGNYQAVLRAELPRAIENLDLMSPEIPAMLDLALKGDLGASDEDPGDGGLFAGFDEIVDAITVRAMEAVCVNSAIAAGVARRLLSNCSGSGRVFRNWRTSMPSLETGCRRRILESIGAEVSESDSGHMVAFYGARAGLVTSVDLPWLLERAFAPNSPGESRNFWLMCVRSVFDRTSDLHVSAAHQYRSDQTIAFLLEPPPALEVANEEDREETGPSEDELSGEVRRVLAESLSPERFAQVVHCLHFAPQQARMTDDLQLDVTRLPGWAPLSEADHQAIRASAMDYILHVEIRRLTNASGRQIALAEVNSVRALALLGVDNLTLATERWADLLYCVLIIHDDPRSRVDLADLAKSLYRLSGDLAPEVLSAVVRAQADFGQFTLRRFSGGQNLQGLLEWLGVMAADETVDERTASAALSLVLEADPDVGLQIVHDRLRVEQQGSRSVLLAGTALGEAPGRAWPILRAELSQDRELFSRVFLQAAGKGVMDMASMSDSQCAELWMSLHEFFPPSEDPVVRGVHAVTPRESVARARDRILPHLADRGSADAVDALQVALEATGESYINRYIGRARDSLRASEWRPLGVREISLVLSSSIAESGKRVPPRFWNPFFAVCGGFVALGSAAVVGYSSSVLAGLSLGGWLVALALSVSLVLQGRSIRKLAKWRTISPVGLPWQFKLGVAMLTVLAALLPIVITVLLK